MVEESSTTCAACGIVFSFPKEFMQKLRENHKTFYCPNGHTLIFPAKTEAETLKERLNEIVTNANKRENELQQKLNRCEGDATKWITRRERARVAYNQKKTQRR